MRAITAEITMSDSEYGRMTADDKHLLNRLMFEYRRADLVEMHFGARGFAFDKDHRPWQLKVTAEEVE